MSAFQKDVFVASRTHELRVFTGSVNDARQFAAGLIEQLRDQGPVSRNPYVPMPTQRTPENWREGLDGTACRFRQGVTSCSWNGPAGLEVRIEDASTETAKPDWRKRARARVGDQVEARMAELAAEPPMSAEEFDEAMRQNKAEAEAHLDRQSRGIPETTPDAPMGGED